MTSEFLEILSDEANTGFKATTCALAKLKFTRLLKKHPGHNEYGNVLLKSAKDIANEKEYDKYLAWLSNPRAVKGNRNPHPSCTGEALPEIVEYERPEMLKSSGDTVVLEREQIKDMANATFIHVKHCPYDGDSDTEEEKVFES